MTYEDVLHDIDRCCFLCEDKDCDKEKCLMIWQKRAVEKQIPKKPEKIYCPYTAIQKDIVCPICKNSINTEDKYCKHCGQALDWSK